MPCSNIQMEYCTRYTLLEPIRLREDASMTARLALPSSVISSICHSLGYAAPIVFYTALEQILGLTRRCQVVEPTKKVEEPWQNVLSVGNKGALVRCQ
jgi:hypothetical protein